MVPSKFYEGVEAVIYIALNSGAKPVSSKQICESQGKAPRHLEPVMQLLVRGGILKGTKGPKGGYTLAKEKRKITLAKLFKLFLEFDGAAQTSSDINKKIILPLDGEIKKNIITSLEKSTIEDLCRKANDVSPKEQGDNFNI